MTSTSNNSGSNIVVPRNDVFRVVQPLVAGNNVITHNLGFSPVEVEVRDTITGALVAVRAINETNNSVVLRVAVAMTSVKISIDS
jgi:hypothetical protein